MFQTRLSVSSRFMLVLAIGFVCQACISVAFLPVLQQSLLRDRTTEVKHLDEAAYSIAKYYHDLAEKGRMSDAAARHAAADTIRAMHYDGENYFFVWSLDGTGIAHGAHPEWEGKRFINSAQARKNPGVAFMVARLIDVAKSAKKEGVTTYRIPRFGQTIPIDKIAYSRLFSPWGWSIGTGAYVDDIDATFRTEIISLLWLFSGLIAIASVITFILGRDLAKALTRLSARVASVAAGEFDGDVPAIERRDEVGVMARALLVLRDNSREAVVLKLDQLTGLPNRKLLTDRLKQAMAASARSGNYGGLMFLDLDKFKALNDTQGHDAGDMLLKETARRLTACVREGDTVARLGGDEFVVVVIDIGQHPDEAAAALESIGAQVLRVLNRPFAFGNITHAGSASIGLTLFRGHCGSVEDVLKQADLAMYKAKESGRNSCRFFDPIMETAVRDRAALEADLLAGIESEQFKLYFQAQSGPNAGIKAAEALIRWHHPQRGLVMPDEFIPFAEETGLIIPLGRWVLEQACKQIVAWSSQPLLAELKIAVNVSSLQFQQPDFVEQVMETVRQTGADPSRLDLELTESLLIDDVDEVIAKMQALRAMGISFTLDDFGTGYSSLYYLKHMPLDQLKIDRTFVRDLLTDPNDAAIANTIVALARTLGLSVIAEGVETAEQRDFLVEVGCVNFQGYLFGRPVPAEEFEAARRAESPQSRREIAVAACEPRIAAVRPY